MKQTNEKIVTDPGAMHRWPPCPHIAKDSDGTHWKCQELQLFDMFGGRFALSHFQLSGLLTQRRTLIWVVLATLGLFAVDPNQYLAEMAWPLALIRWSVSSALFLCLLWAWFFAAARANQIFNLPPFPAELLTLPPFLAVFLFDLAVTGVVSDANGQVAMIQKLPFLVTAFLVLELFYIRFVLPSFARAEVAPEPTSAHQSALAPDQKRAEQVQVGLPALLDLGARKVRADTLLSIRSQEHYLTISTEFETITIRAKMPDVLAQLEDNMGIRCHRSWWVAKRSKPVLQGNKGNSQMKLKDGQIVPVARSRFDDVRLWLDLNRTW